MTSLHAGVFVIATLVVAVSSLTATTGTGVHKGHGHEIHQKTEYLEGELLDLRASINKNRENIASLGKRERRAKVGQPEFTNEDLEDELTEVRPLDIPLHHHEPDDVVDYRRYATTTVRTLDVDVPAFEEDEDETEDEEQNSEQSGDEKRKRGGGVDRDDDDDDEGGDGDGDDDEDEEEDDDEYDEGETREKKVNAEEDGSVGMSTKEELLRDVDVFLDTTKRSTLDDHREADFEGLTKIQQIREIDKRVNIPLKEKYVNAIDPKADEDLLELMVKIAENPKEWENVHGLLQRLDQDLVASHDAVQYVNSEDAKKLANKRDEDNIVSLQNNPDQMTKEERKHLQAEEKKKKKKKKKQRQKLERERLEKERLQKESDDKNDIDVKGKTLEDLRREQLVKAGFLNSGRLKDQSKDAVSKSIISAKSTTTTTTTTTTPAPTTTTTTTTRQPTTVVSILSTWLPKELKANSKLTPHGAENHMKTINSAIDFLSKDNPKIKLAPDTWPKPKSPMQIVREQWPPALSDKNKHMAKSIVNGRLRPSNLNNDRLKFNGASHEKPIDKSSGWSKSNIGAAPVEDMERARARFLKETLGTRNNVAYWKPNAKTKWLETSPLRSKEQRANHNTYFNGKPNYNQQNNGWPYMSVDSLKHGNLGHIDKTWPEITKAPGNDNENSNWPKLPSDPNTDLDNDKWPDFSANPIHNSVSSVGRDGWGKYPSPLDAALIKHRESLANNWPDIPHQKTSSVIEHAKDVNANNRQWPHFAYHRVTSSPQSLARQQKEAQQRARHRSAYIAVSIIAPPGKNRSLNYSQGRVASAEETMSVKLPKTKVLKEQLKLDERPPLPDKIDELLLSRGQSDPKLTPVDPLEEQLIDMAANGMDVRNKFNWSHSRHLDKIQEQLKTLSAMEEKLRFQWLEKERLRQILRDGGKSGSNFFREPRAADTQENDKSTKPPDPVTPFDTTKS